MPRPRKSARLYLRAGRQDGDRWRPAVWIIRDGGRDTSTGCGESEIREAEKSLQEYIGGKYQPERLNSRSPSAIPIADVLTIYCEDVAPRHAKPENTISRCDKLLEYFGDKMLSAVNGALCRDYAKWRGSDSAARRELEDLKAAINHHRREGLCSEIVGVALPEKGLPKDRWLTRIEAARLLWAAWRARQKGRGGEPDRLTRQHLARFILVGLYTGTRAGAICGASFVAVSGRGWVDLENGRFYRKALGVRETTKRQPTATIPPRLLAHMRRWQRLGLCETAIVEWQGRPVTRVSKSFARAAKDAGLDGVSPHTLRHTAATWMMQNGVSLDAAAGYLGMTRNVLDRVYAHHAPGYQAEAVAGIGRRNAK